MTDLITARHCRRCWRSGCPGKRNLPITPDPSDSMPMLSARHWQVENHHAARRGGRGSTVIGLFAASWPEFDTYRYALYHGVATLSIAGVSLLTSRGFGVDDACGCARRHRLKAAALSRV